MHLWWAWSTEALLFSHGCHIVDRICFYDRVIILGVIIRMYVHEMIVEQLAVWPSNTIFGTQVCVHKYVHTSMCTQVCAHDKLSCQFFTKSSWPCHYFSMSRNRIECTGQVHTYCLVNDERYEKYYYCHKTGSRMLVFDGHVYIWFCPVLEIIVKVVHTSTANVSEMITDMANDKIAIQ